MFLLKCSDLRLVLQGGIDHIEPIEQHCTVARSNGEGPVLGDVSGE